MPKAEPATGRRLLGIGATALLALGLWLWVGCDPGRDSADPAPTARPVAPNSGRSSPVRPASREPATPSPRPPAETRPTAAARAGAEPALDRESALHDRVARRAEIRESSAPDSRPPLDLRREAREDRHPERAGGPSQRYVFRDPAAGEAHTETAPAASAAVQPADLAFADVEARDYLGLLENRDPVLRAEAARNIDPEGMGLQALLVVLAEDPDPLVRVAAVAQLEDADDPAGARGLVAALGDGDRRVVLEAIDALEFAADEWVIPDLQPLLDHPDEEIRIAAEEAIEFLQ